MLSSTAYVLPDGEVALDGPLLPSGDFGRVVTAASTIKSQAVLLSDKAE